MQEIQRILLKVTGQVFGNKNGESSIFDREALEYISTEVAGSLEKNPNVALAIVVGGGNIARGGKLIRHYWAP